MIGENPNLKNLKKKFFNEDQKDKSLNIDSKYF